MKALFLALVPAGVALAVLGYEVQVDSLHTPDSRAFNARSVGLGESALSELRIRFRAGEPPHGLRD